MSINRFNLFGNYKNKVFRLIYISDIDIDNAFNFFDPVGFVKETYVPEIKIITQNKTFQNMVIHAEESFFYVNHSLETCWINYSLLDLLVSELMIDIKYLNRWLIHFQKKKKKKRNVYIEIKYSKYLNKENKKEFKCVLLI